MAEVAPFRGYRYNIQKIGNLKDVVAPPYDVIDEEQRTRLAQGSEFNAVRLILPNEAEVPGARTRYDAAQAFLQEWKETGVMQQDELPALYRYRQDFTVPGTGEQAAREGLIASVRLHNFSEKIILPHEKTLEGPKEDRLALLEATHTNLSPTFSFYFDPDGQIAGALGEADPKPWADFTDEEGVRHRFWAITDKAALKKIGEAFSKLQLFLADGHHRYTTALHYRDRLKKKAGHLDAEHPAQSMMMFVAEAAQMTVLPYHRMLLSSAANGATAEGLVKKLAGHFAAKEFKIASADDQARFNSALASDPAHYALGIAGKGKAWLLQVKDAKKLAAAFDEKVPAVLRDLDVAVLQEFVLQRELGFDTEKIGKGGVLKYSPNFAKVFGALNDGSAAIGFLLRPTRLEQVRDVALAGEVMPQKSTYFYPKIGSGFVFRSVE